MGLRVLLADGSPVVRRAVRTWVEQRGIAVASETADGEEAVALCRACHPDVAILGFRLTRLTGLDAGRRIRESASDTHVILLTLYIEEQRIVAALRAGIRGYVGKDRASDELVPAIQAVTQGRVYLSPGFSHLLSAHSDVTSNSSGLDGPRLRLGSETVPSEQG
jgi:DNA-binding NarL/FixJ family response regulator